MPGCMIAPGSPILEVFMEWSSVYLVNDGIILLKALVLIGRVGKKDYSHAIVSGL